MESSVKVSKQIQQEVR